MRKEWSKAKVVFVLVNITVCDRVSQRLQLDKQGDNPMFAAYSIILVESHAKPH